MLDERQRTVLLSVALGLMLAGCKADPGTGDAGPDALPGDHSVDRLAPDLLAPDLSPCARCTTTQVCVQDRCCKAPSASGAFKLPAHVSWVHWTFSGPAAAIEFPVRIVDDPGTKVGLFFVPMQGVIEGITFYFGIQTDVSKPNVGGTGKGVIFNRWDTLDPTYTRVATGGFIEIGTHEGNFVGVRQNIAWTPGEYTLRIARADSDGAADWFEATIKDAGGTITPIGGLKFDRKAAATPSTIEETGTLFCEVYSNATDFSAVPAWSLEVKATADGAPAIKAVSEYPAFPYAEYPNKDTFYDPATDRVHLTYGGMTPECHPAGTLF
jgi:hypothetical protein